MSLLRPLQRFYRNRPLGRAGRLIAATLLLAASLAQPAAAPIMAAPILAAPPAVAPLEPQGGCSHTVNSTSDSVAGSLRSAVLCATTGVNHTVTFNLSLANQILSVTAGDITVTVPITIDGSGAPGVMVDAGNLSRVFNISASGPVTLTGLTLQHGHASGNGGAVLANNALVLNQVQVLTSTATGTGGGLWAGSATLINTQFISNTSGSDAGGAWVQAGTTVVTGGRFERNTCAGGACQGGGLNVDSLTLSGTQFISNTAAGQGGGAWAYSPAGLTNASLQGNQCTDGICEGGGLYANSTLTLTNSDFISNTSVSHGGGAWANSAVLLTNGLFEGNHCTASGCQAGGLAAVTTLTLSGTQFISNTSVSYGGGAIAGGAAGLTGGRFERNTCSGSNCQGGGLVAGGTLTLAGTDFISNTSDFNGGGAVAVGAAVLTNGLFQANRCKASNCQGGGLTAGTTLTLTGTDFISNTSNLYGGGAAVGGSALLTNGLFQGNQCAGAGCQGGGLAAGNLPTNSVTLNGTHFIGNTSTGNGGGGYTSGAAVLTNGSFEQNRCTGSGCLGGGLDVSSTLTLTGTDFISNTSFSDGGGLYAASAAVLTNGRFQGNHCTDSVNGCWGGGLLSGGALTVTSTDFISNTSTGGGGGLEANLPTTVLRSSFSGNQSAGSGGGIALFNAARLILANVTLSGNTASVSGGGLYAGGISTASLWNVSVADNQAPSGGGVAADINSSLAITNTIVSNNSGGNCSGTIVAGTHNLEFPGTTCATAGPAAGFTTADPLLAPLALNPPGATLTQALLPGSPARDHGNPASCGNPLVNNLDQRGAVRPDAGGEACDIGAYEAGAPDWLVFLPLVRK